MKLYEPVSIGKLVLKNRIAMAAMRHHLNLKEDGSLSQDGTPQPELINYYVRRAAGGVGLIITEMAACYTPRFPYSGIGVWQDECIPPLSRLVAAVKAYGSRICLQLHQWGSWDYPLPSRLAPPGAARRPTPYPGPMELSPEEIEDKIEKYAQGARRARRAGFDAVELHGAHQHPLLAQFLSAHMNKRTDGYGGSPEKKARFAQEVIRRCKQVAGEDFPVIFRFSAEEHAPQGMTLEEAKLVAPLLVEAGADALHISAGAMSSIEWAVPPHLFPAGVNVHLAEAIKRVVKVPVITVGRITSPRLANSILEQGRADLIAVGRALLADPDWARKGLEGREREIRVCIGCNSCYDTARPVGRWCLMNPELGRRKEFEEETTRVIHRRRVAVVGGGPAGIEAARVATLRGHQVVLYEEDTRGEPWSWLIQSWVTQRYRELKEAGVRIERGRKVSPEVVIESEPEVILVGEEGIPVVPSIFGVKQDNVFTADDILGGKASVGRRAVVLGGGSAGCQAAEFLSRKGTEVILVEKGDIIGIDIGVLHLPALLSRLEKQGVQFLTHQEVTEIRGNIIRGTDSQGKAHSLEGDTIILALGYRTSADTLKLWQGKAREVHLLPFCPSPRYALEAAHAGAALACRI